VALIDDLIAHEGRSSTGLFIRLAVDGLVQRLASTATVWTVVAVLVATSFGGLAVSDFAGANALQVVPRTVDTVAPAWHELQTPRHLPRWHRTSRRSAPQMASGNHSRWLVRHRLRHQSNAPTPRARSGWTVQRVAYRAPHDRSQVAERPSRSIDRTTLRARAAATLARAVLR
jgi:hypothetical protein